MTLADADIDRYARQIVLPEVGGRGQERLLESTAAIVGDRPAADLAAEALRRAGVRTTASDGDVLVDVRSAASPFPDTAGNDRIIGRIRRGSVEVLALPAGTTATPVDVPDGGDEDSAASAACAAHVLGALAATEALRLLLGHASGRFVSIDLGTGRVTARPLGQGGPVR